MKYYVVTDVHGFFYEMKNALEEKGYFADNEPHKLIVCGDLFDRGGQAKEMQSFIMDLLEKDEVILIRGNHEDLMLSMINNWHRGSYMQEPHFSNGTVGTALQLAKPEDDSTESLRRNLIKTPYIQRIIPAMLDYYETPHYIFVHGWIPCTVTKLTKYLSEYTRIDGWRDADAKAWHDARWINGMEAAYYGVTEPDKTIVCGHWHTSFGHSRYESRGGEFENLPDFTPYCADGIIALDACTAFSKKVNCIVIED